MKTLPSLSSLLSVGLLATGLIPGASAQVSVVSTRTFTDEVFDLRNPSTLDFLGFIAVDLGLGRISSHGSPQFVEFDLNVEMDIDLDILNVYQTDASYCYATFLQIQPNFGDCSPYDGEGFFETTSAVPPGASASLQVNRDFVYAWSGATFNPACFNNEWNWPGLFLNTDPGNNNVLTSCAGAAPNVFPSWVQTNHAFLTINGEVSATWNPNPLSFQTVCAGSAAPSVSLEPYGGFGPVTSSVYLFQDGAPASTNLLIEANQATPTIQPSGLCVAGTIRRVPGSLSQGGQPFRLPDADAEALIGTTTYFQSWFRTGAGTSATSECIELTVP